MRVSPAIWEALAGAALTGACVALAWPSQPAPPLERSEAAPSQTPMRSEAEPVADYALVARFNADQHTVSGKGTITWRNRSSHPVNELWVHLYLNAFKNTGSAFLRERTPGSGRGSGPVSDFGWIDVRKFLFKEDGDVNLWPGAEAVDPSGGTDATDWRVPLSREAKPGEELHFWVEWESKLPSIVERTGYRGSFHMVAQWFPKIAKLEPDGSFAHFPFHHLAEFYADYGSYSVSIERPKTFEIAATGRLTGEKTEQDLRVDQYVADNVHDFAFALWDRFERKETSAEGVKVSCLYPRGYGAVADQQLEAAAFALKHFGDRYGRYPYPTLTIVHPPAGADEAGGMEYPTLITTGGPWFVPRQIGSVRALTIHEFAHQYFYGLIATNEQRWPFLDEGLGSWAELRALDSGWGPGSIVDLGGMKISAATIMRAAAMWGGNNERVAQAANEFDSAADYGTIVYMRTATILETLDRVWPGKMAEAIGSYARRYRFAHPAPADLEREVEQVAGPEAARQLHLALFERGSVDYVAHALGCGPKHKLYGTLDQADGRTVVTESESAEAGYSCTAVVVRRGNLTFPVEVELIAADGSRQRRHWDGIEESHTLTYEGASPLVSMVVDPDRNVLLDEDLSNNAVRAGGPQRSWRAWEAVAFAGSMALIGATP